MVKPDERESAFPASSVLWSLLVIAVIIGALVAATIHRAAAVRPEACGGLAEPLGQLASDLNYATEQAKTGPVRTDALQADTSHVQQLTAGTPPAFASRVQPIVDTMNRLLADMHGPVSSEPQEFVTLARKTQDAMAWCGLKP